MDLKIIGGLLLAYLVLKPKARQINAIGVICNDGTYTEKEAGRGVCSRHGGIEIGNKFPASDIVPELQLVRTKRVVKLGKPITKSEDAANIVREAISKLRMEVSEHMVILLVNQANEPIGYVVHSLGGTAGTIVDTGLVASSVLISGAVGVIMAHNHPSGNLNPSSADVAISKKLKESLKLIDKTLLDSLVITKDSYTSLADEGYL
jgi:DNA repair protein RadC